MFWAWRTRSQTHPGLANVPALIQSKVFNLPANWGSTFLSYLTKFFGVHQKCTAKFKHFSYQLIRHHNPSSKEKMQMGILAKVLKGSRRGKERGSDLAKEKGILHGRDLKRKSKWWIVWFHKESSSKMEGTTTWKISKHQLIVQSLSWWMNPGESWYLLPRLWHTAPITVLLNVNHLLQPALVKQQLLSGKLTGMENVEQGSSCNDPDLQTKLMPDDLPQHTGD